MAREWFRRSTWSTEDERAFFDKLAKARSANRAQYLRIQASHLAHAKPPLHAAALALLAYLIDHYPEPFEMSAAHQQMAYSLAQLGQVGEACDQYRRSIQWTRERRSGGTRAWLEFALLVAEHRLRGSYDEVLVILDEFKGPHIAFPADVFDRHAARALIFADGRIEAGAREEAIAALAAAARDHSGFRHHSLLGLVGPEREHLLRQMKRLADPPRGLLDRIGRLLH